MKPQLIVARQLILVVIDIAMVTLAFLAAYALRFHSGWIPLRHAVPPLGWYTQPLGVIVLVYLLFFRAVGLYAMAQLPRPYVAIGAVAHGATLASTILMALTFFYRDTSYSRLLVLLAWGCTILFVPAGRWIFYRGMSLWFPQWRRQPRLLIVGTGPAVPPLLQRLQHQQDYRVVGLIHTATPGPRHPDAAFPDGTRVLGDLTDLPHLLATRTVDEVILTDSDLPRPQIMALILQCEQRMVTFRMVPDLLGLLTMHVGLQSLDGIPVLGLRETPLNDPWNRVVKRAMDLSVAGLGLLLTAPAWVVIAWAIRWDSPGPVFYLQKRVGQDGRHFTMIKFRTMRPGAEAATGPVWATPGDARRTRVGTFLRRWNLDELPQLFNVLRGDMSLVGPRPERPHFVRQFRQDVPRYMARHRIRSGITGWAQIHGLRGDTSIEERTTYDLYYLENWSLWLDCKILLKSLAAVKNAY